MRVYILYNTHSHTIALYVTCDFYLLKQMAFFKKNILLFWFAVFCAKRHDATQCMNIRKKNDQISRQCTIQVLLLSLSPHTSLTSESGGGSDDDGNRGRITKNNIY